LICVGCLGAEQEDLKVVKTAKGDHSTNTVVLLRAGKRRKVA
jgi:hypothetical protein